MRKIVLLTAIFLAISSMVMAGERVRGHWKDTNRDGIKDTYVQPYNRSERNDSVFDNYSTKGNINPYTGERGTVYLYKNLYNNPYSNPYSNPYGR